MKKRILIPLLILCALPVILFRDSLFAGKALFLDDLEAWSYPIRFFQYEMGLAGKIFKWNPYFFSGTPYLADPQSGLFYPLNWIFFLRPPEEGLPLFLTFHFAMAGILLYIFLGRRQFDISARMGGAVVYMLSGFMVLHSIHPGIIAAYSLIPLGLILCDRAIEDCSIWNSCLLGIFLAFHIFIGALQMTFIMLIILLIHSLFNISKKPSGVTLIRLTIFLVIPAIVAVFLSLVQVLPSLELFMQTPRSATSSVNEMTNGSLGIAELIMMLIPDRYGHPLSSTPFRGELFYWEICMFIGIVPLMLALYGLLTADSKQKKERVAFLVIAAVALFLAMGKYNPLYVHLTSLPFIKSFRVPMRFMVMFLLSLSYLAAAGIQNLPGALVAEDRGARIRNALSLSAVIGFFLIVSAALICTAGAAPTPGTAEHLVFGVLALLFMWAAARKTETALPMQYCLVAVLAASAFSFACTWNPTVPREYFAERKSLFSELGGKTPPLRIHYYPPFEMKETLNLPSTCGVSNSVGYDPLVLSDYLEYLIYSDYGQMLNDKARSRLTAKGNIFGLQRPDAPLMRLLSLDGSFSFKKTENVYIPSYTRFSNGLPRVFLAPHRRVIPDREKLLNILSSKDFKAREEILFLDEPPDAAAPASPAVVKPGKNISNEGAEITLFSPDMIVIRSSVREPCYLFIGEIFYPGWKALVDGKSRKVLKGDYIFRVIQLFPGEREVILLFSPDSFTIGYLISGLTLIACVVVAIFSCRRR